MPRQRERRRLDQQVRDAWMDLMQPLQLMTQSFGLVHSNFSRQVKVRDRRFALDHCARNYFPHLAQRPVTRGGWLSIGLRYWKITFNNPFSRTAPLDGT